ncbi:MAG: DUF58 domain-containing protein [Acidobacteria bacterium]|nr:DUF58 domain-containing protein [Acidobacteriota bacterium]
MSQRVLTSFGQSAEPAPPAANPGRAAAGDSLPRARRREIPEGRRTVAALVFAGVLSGICGYFVHPNGYAVTASILALLLAGLVLPRLGTLSLRGSLQFGRARIQEGETVAATFRLSNTAPWPVFGIGVDRAGLGESWTGVHLSWLPGLCTREVRTQIGPLCRGEYPTLRPSVRSGFPLSLLETGAPVAVEAPLLVWPRRFPVGPLPENDPQTLREGSFESRRIGSGGELAGLRPYRRGDSLRQIHWQQSARHDRLIVCERQATYLPRIRIVLDADPASHAGEGANGTLEWSIRVAASLAEGWAREGAEVTILFGDRALAPASGERQVREILDLAASVPRDGVSFAATLRHWERDRDAYLTLLVTTDAGLAGPARSLRADRSMWFAVLRCDGFGGGKPSIARTADPARTLWIVNGESAPAALRRGWTPARGSCG